MQVAPHGPGRHTARKAITVTGLQPCGTAAAYVRHLRDGSRPCAPCYAAHAAYERDRNARRSAQRQINADIRQLVHVLAVAMGVGKEAA
jgi:hypothetical protein